MAGKVLQAAVVGASTLLGKELTQEISESAAAAWDMRLLDESDEAEGQLTSAGDEALVIHKLSGTSFEGVDVLFFAGTKESTTEYAAAAKKAGAAIVDLTGALAGHPGFVVRSPWLQQDVRPDLTTVGIVAPHPAALMLATVMTRLESRFGVASMVATLLEPASEAGSAGVDELHQQTVGLLSFQEVPKVVYGTQVAFNVPGVLGSEAGTSLADTRARIAKDMAFLLGTGFSGNVSLQLLQAPVFHGYIASAYVQLRKPAASEEVRSALHGGIVVAEAETAPSNQAATESGDLLVRVDAVADPGEAYWLTMAADNLRIAARNAVSAAMELVALRPAARVQ